MRTLPRLLFAVPILAGCSSDDPGSSDPSLIHTVARSDLAITVRERGELKASRDTRVSSQLEGRATLIYLVPEGSMVEQGEKLAELDVSSIEERRALQAIQVAKAEAAVLQARKNVEIMEKELIAAERVSANALKIAQLRMQKFLGQPTGADRIDSGSIAGTNADMVARLRSLFDDLSRDLEEAASEASQREVGLEAPSRGIDYDDLHAKLLETITAGGDLEQNLRLEMGELSNLVLQNIDQVSLARADLKLAEETLVYSQRLQAQNFVTKNQLAKDEISYQRQRSQETVAWNNLSLLIKYTLPENLITLQQDVENGGLGLESVLASAEARRVREAAELVSSEAEFRLAKQQLDTYIEQTENAVMFAPTPGLVIYGRWDWDEPVYEGMEVRERQDIVILPDISTMVAELKIHESQIGKVAVGQLATIRIDAFPSRLFSGRVTTVATLPNATRRSSDPKVFEVVITLDGGNEAGELRPSMNGTVIVDVGTLRDVLNVPMTALERSGDVQFVWRVTPEGPVPTRVELGGNNLTHVEVLSGLQAGDRIYLVRPDGVQLPDASDGHSGAGVGPDVEDGSNPESASAASGGTDTGDAR